MSSDAQWSPKHQWRWVNLHKMAFFAIRIWAIQSIIFWKSIRATWLNPFILFQVSGGQDEELAAKLICLYGAYNEEDPSYSTPGKLNSSSFMCHWAAFIGMNGAPSPNAVSRFYLLHPWKANSENQRVSDFFLSKKQTNNKNCSIISVKTVCLYYITALTGCGRCDYWELFIHHVLSGFVVSNLC